MKIPRGAILAYLDFADSLKIGLFDTLIFVLMFVGVILSYVQYYGRPAGLALGILGPTLLAAALYLSLRSAAGLAHMARDRILDIYITYPISRGTVAVVLFISRVLVPATLIVSLPALAAAIVYYPLIKSAPTEYIEMWGAFLIQAIFYGVTFSLIALLTRSGGGASIGSLLFYFTYNILGVVMSNLAGSYESILYKASRAMTLYLVVYQKITKPSIAPLPSSWELLFVPLLTTAVLVAFLVYFKRWYEP